MSELDKLEAYLKECKAIYRRIDKLFFVDENDKKLREFVSQEEGFGERHQIIVYDKKGQYLWDAICHWGSYGYEEGLLEIMGSIVDEKKDGNTVAGYLTADDVIARIKAVHCGE